MATGRVNSYAEIHLFIENTVKNIGLSDDPL
jgi:hypothetical protein